MATPAINIIPVATATIPQPSRELGCHSIIFLSEATIRIASKRNGASRPLMTAVQYNAFTGLMPAKLRQTAAPVESRIIA